MYACVCVLTSTIVLVCVEELQPGAGSQQSLCAIQTGSNRLADLLCRQGALCTQQHIKHSQFAGGEDRLRNRGEQSITEKNIMQWPVCSTPSLVHSSP